MSTQYRPPRWTRCLLAAFLICPLARVSAQFDAPRAHVTENLRISGADEDFVTITGLFVAPDGRIGVTQPKDGKAIIFTSEGKRAVVLGGIGDGPGEFRSMGVAGWRGDTIWIWDGGPSRITTFTSTGKVIATRSLASVVVGPRVKGIPPGLSHYSAIALYGDGTVLANRVAPSRDLPPTIVVRISPRGEVERIAMQHAPDPSSLAITHKDGSGFYSGVPFMSGIDNLFAADGNRIGYVETVLNDTGGNIRILVVGAAGDTLVSRMTPFVGTRITQAEKDSVVETRLKQRQGPAVQMGRGGATQTVASRYVSPADLAEYESVLRARMPDFHPPIVTAKFGIDNTIWIETRSTPAETQWSMLSEHGDPELTILLPKKTRLMQASRTTIWTVQLDEDDIPSVVRFRIERSP